MLGDELFTDPLQSLELLWEKMGYSREVKDQMANKFKETIQMQFNQSIEAYIQVRITLFLTNRSQCERDVKKHCKEEITVLR